MCGDEQGTYFTVCGMALFTFYYGTVRTALVFRALTFVLVMS